MGACSRALMSADTHPCKKLFGVFYPLNTLAPSHSQSATFDLLSYSGSLQKPGIVRSRVNVVLWS